MHKFFNACLMLVVLVSGFFLYSLEHSTRGYERQIAKLKSGISEERESIKVLGAEWSSLTRPDRLQKLAQENLKLQTVTASQFVSEDELAERVPAEPIIMLEEKGKDVIGDILKEMQ
jgi:cell division protein FtsL